MGGGVKIIGEPLQYEILDIFHTTFYQYVGRAVTRSSLEREV